MSFLKFYGEDAPEPEPPRRVYARVDHIERPSPDERRVVLLDSVDADWISGYWPISLVEPWGADEAGERVSVVETWLDPGEKHLKEDLGVPAEEDEGWLELELGDPGTGRPVRHYLNLYAAGLERAISSVSRPPPSVEANLTSTTSLRELADAARDEIEAVLQGIGAAEAAAIYDVGQGNCNALLRGAFPVLYFDLGGGVLQNAHTFPQALHEFCFTKEPPIVLSHWDWDHWSSANRDTRALASTWIVPRHDNSLGPVHATFLGKIRSQGRALIWPQAVDDISAGDLTVLRCTGRPKQRNSSGLALLLERQSEGMWARMLFPGDCAYDHVPRSRLDYTHVVVPHHGGRTGSTFVPAPDGVTCGRLVYSYGANNSYGHPFPDVVRDHACLWATDLRTEARDSSGLGHIHLYWDEATPDAHPPCGGRLCQLTCHQRP